MNARNINYANTSNSGMAHWMYKISIKTLVKISFGAKFQKIRHGKNNGRFICRQKEVSDPDNKDEGVENRSGPEFLLL